MKILLIRLSSIGDIVLTSPVLRCLAMQTGAEIHYLTKKAFAPIVEANPHVHRVWHYEKGMAALLRAERFDYVIDLHKNLRTLRLRWALGCKAFSFPKLNWQKWILVRFKINRMPDLHIVDRYFESVKALGVQNDGAGLDYFIPDDQRVQPAELDARLAQPYIALVLGAAHATKALPIEQLRRLCTLLQQPVALIGGKEEMEKAAELAGLGEHLVPLCGKLSLHQSASVVQQAQCVITGDTGMMHIAAAFRQRIVSIWGNTVPAFGMYPYYPTGIDRNTYIQNNNLSCRPCSKIGFSACPKGHFRCMRELEMGKVVDSVSMS